MSWRGFLPEGVQCTGCGAELQGEGSGRPAESYLGTYTGLCHSCTSQGPVRDESSQYVSGAWSWSHPPALPSWRRDRERYFAFSDCQKCKGQGCVTQSRSSVTGGSYGTQCSTCSDRHQKHPLVSLISDYRAARDIRRKIVLDVAYRVFDARADKAGLPQERTLDADGKPYTPPEEGEIKKAIEEDLRPVLGSLDPLSPIEWPKGYKPLIREVRGVHKAYSGMWADLVSKILPLPAKKTRSA